MVFVRVEQPGENVRVTDLVLIDAEYFERIELMKLLVETVEFGRIFEL
ncbi:hypothetical protein [Exiguobacterium sp. SL-9]|nr:hypothetical protein [Exiguobacterium sp. SL-9]